VQREYDRMKPLGAEFTTPPTKVTGSTIAVVNDTCGNLIQIAALDRWGLISQARPGPLGQ
jgi:predicted enzyme related to lactoylglutathione lyase